MNHKKTLIVLAIAMMAMIPVSIMMSDESDAGMEIRDAWGDGFSNNGDGTLFIVLKNTESSDTDITITVKEDGRELAKETVTVPADTESYTAELRFRIDGLGSHDLTITCEPVNLFPIPPSGDPLNYWNVTVNVGESIWTKPSTYAAIIVVALLIVIAAYLRMRNAPATKPDTTFTELEKQKGGSTREAESKPKASATERRRYSTPSEPSKPPVAEAPPAPPKEKKASSFTELDKEKKESASKPKTSEEPKKLKYVSSRRK